MTATVPETTESPAPIPPATRGEQTVCCRGGVQSERVTVTIVALALLASVAYVAWRSILTINWTEWWLAVPLLLLEIHAVVSLSLFAFVTLDVTVPPAETTAPETVGTVAVLIPTYNEPLEVLLPTVAAAVALQPAHETWILDDGRRPEVEALASMFDARYLTRTVGKHAKAGNLNHALSVIDTDFVAILDADSVALPGFLRRTLGYFSNPRLALVQTPEDFYNVDSFQHEWVRRRLSRHRTSRRYSEQEIFYRVIQPGMNRRGATFWCGTGSVLRVAALREIGGVAIDSVTEDIHTTIRLHRRGWTTLFHDEILARGLAAADLSQYTIQRVRWGAGAMQILVRENPLFVSGLTIGQRLAYAQTLLGWFDAWRSLGFLLIPPVVLLTGARPIRASAVVFLVALAVTFLLQRIAQQRLSRGHAPLGLSTIFALTRMQAHLRATLTLVVPSSMKFRVTPKGRVGADRRRSRVPILLCLVLALHLLAGVWFALSVAGLTPLHYRALWSAYAASGWLVLDSALVLVAVARVRAERFARERRTARRFERSDPVFLDDSQATMRNISWTGASLIVPAQASVPDSGRIQLRIGRLVLATGVRGRSRSPCGDHQQITLEFHSGQDDARAQLALALLQRETLPYQRQQVLIADGAAI